MTSDALRDLLVDGLSADRVAELFYRKGLVAFARTMPEDWIARTLNLTMELLEARLGREAGTSEVVERSPARFDIKLTSGSRPSAALPPSEAEAILAAVGAILGDGWRVELHGAVVALPGAGEMPWHVDGSHLFPELPIHLPAHALNLFIPLVDITEDLGPTEFCPGSHFLTRGTQPSYIQSSVAPESLGYTDRPVRAAIPAGAAVLFDFRTLHRAMPNRSGQVRPILYLSCAKHWFRDGAFSG